MQKSQSHCFFLTLLFLFTSHSFPFPAADSRTQPADIQTLRRLKAALNRTSILAGSCISSWDFSLDPCDHISTFHFTCGFRCDLLVAGASRVTEITLDPVGYSGSLPDSIAFSTHHHSLIYLQTFDISDNSISGPIPHWLSSLTRLRRLTLSRNSLSGLIPPSLGSLPLLQELYLDNNRLSGPIPPTFNNLTRLRRLEVQVNHISGKFPDLGLLRNLYFLDASDNNLTGNVPAEYLPASLIELVLRNNNFRGRLPDNFGDIVFLQVLDLSRNKLSGEIISALFEHPSLEQLTLSYNNFTRLRAPASVGLMKSKLVAIDLSYNEIGGFLPAFMPMMPGLSALSLEHNLFTGTIPVDYAVKAVVDQAGNTSPFERLLLGGNYLFGLIPGPLVGLKPGSAEISLVDNCLYRCPENLFFCQGKGQKSLVECKRFLRRIP